MRATSIGHAGILFETGGGSILCDPWFEPAFLGSWFVFPRNDRLGGELDERIENADFLYISHIHGDHLDEPWLRTHLRRDIPVLVPDFPTDELERTLRELGFTTFIHPTNAELTEIAPGLSVAIHVETSITDGPGGDSALVVVADGAVVVDQNDCRTHDLAALAAHGRVDAHFLQHSGAIWYPMVYEETPERMRELVDAKVDSQLTRAMRYVEAIDARVVLPSAGPPCFLDDDLFGLNVIDGDELSIFPDQRAFRERIDAAGRVGVLNIPGTTIEISGDGIAVTHPMPDDEVEAICTDKRAYLEAYRREWASWLEAHRRSWHAPTAELLETLQRWWEPLLAIAPTLRAAVGTGVLLRLGDLDVLIDFPAGEVREWSGEPFGYRFTIQRELVETVVARRAVDWSNALFLSARFSAWREGPFNEYVYNFFKSLSVERMERTEAEAAAKATEAARSTDRSDDAEEIELGGYLVERWCPHRRADLTVFGECDGTTLTCTLHGWQFDLTTGECLTATDRRLRVRPADSK